MVEFYDRDGNKITFTEWAELTGDEDYMLIKEDHIEDVRIETFWVGVVTSTVGMVFTTVVSYSDIEVIHHLTKKEAIEFHKEKLKELSGDTHENRWEAHFHS